MTRGTLRGALEAERPLVMPLAHDALSARLITRAGFRGFAVGGSAMLAARYGLPDIGLIGLADMTAGIRDIAAASNLPFLTDGDDGYGDVKSVVRMVEAYEALGVRAVLIEDQLRERKQQRAEGAKGVAEETVIEAKLRAALAARASRDMMIMGRTDAFGVLGLDAALRRAERFLALGADGVFIAGLRTEADLARAGRELKGALQAAALFEGGDTPWIAPAVMGEMGYGLVTYPASLVFRVAAAMEGFLAGLRAYGLGRGGLTPMANYAGTRALLDEAVGVSRWRAVEGQFAPVGGGD
jgi:2-methylisocitrate lyase-like PEP mutase family enzyme